MLKKRCPCFWSKCWPYVKSMLKNVAHACPRRWPYVESMSKNAALAFGPGCRPYVEPMLKNVALADRARWTWGCKMKAAADHCPVLPERVTLFQFTWAFSTWALMLWYWKTELFKKIDWIVNFLVNCCCSFDALLMHFCILKSASKVREKRIRFKKRVRFLRRVKSASKVRQKCIKSASKARRQCIKHASSIAGISCYLSILFMCIQLVSCYLRAFRTCAFMGLGVSSGSLYMCTHGIDCRFNLLYTCSDWG